MDPLYHKEPNLSPYVYVGNDPLRYFDPNGKIRRDKNGKIIFKSVGSAVPARHPSDKGRKKELQPGYIQADDGTKVNVFQNKSSDTRYDTDCHGVTFADGEFWVNNEEVNKILQGDNYQEIDNPQSGDVVIYKDKNGNVVHSATVVKIDPETGEVTVEGLGGLETDTQQENVNDAWNDPNATSTYYRKTKEENQEEKEQDKKQ